MKHARFQSQLEDPLTHSGREHRQKDEDQIYLCRSGVRPNPEPQPLTVSTSPLTVSIAEACKILGIGRTSLYSLISARQLRVRKIGRRTVIELSELQRFVAELPGANTS